MALAQANAAEMSQKREECFKNGWEEYPSGTAFYFECLTGSVQIVKRMTPPDLDINQFQGGHVGFGMAAAIVSDSIEDEPNLNLSGGDPKAKIFMATLAVSVPARHLRQTYIEISRYFRAGLRSCTTPLTKSWVDQIWGGPRFQCLYSAKCLQRSCSSRYFATRADGLPNARIPEVQISTIDEAVPTINWAELENYKVADGSNEEVVRLFGYVTSYRQGRKVDFLIVADPHLNHTIQIVCPKQSLPHLQIFGNSESPTIRAHTPVSVRGKIVKSQKLPSGMSDEANTFETIDQYVGRVSRIGHIEILAEDVVALNKFPEQLVAKHDIRFPPEMRHLSFRTDHSLRNAIRLRSRVKHECSNFLLGIGFDDIETPLLFKSTPEGAREFVVPTRRRGLAYALPQSPQQYKQVLMASGIPRYFQFARCFRDEDMRADRQPEFTQLDLEMSFASSRMVMSTVEQLILQVIWPVAGRYEHVTTNIREALTKNRRGGHPDLILPVLTYEEAMTRYGSDKPDTRYQAEILRIDGWVSDSLKKMLTNIDQPIVEMLKIQTKHNDPARTREFMQSFMDLLSSSQYLKNPDGMAGISIYDPTKPLCGLASFGHDAASEIEERFEPEEGDLLIALCRPDKPFTGGSTLLGNLRRDLLSYAVQGGLIEQPSEDSMLWVVDFPLFSPVEDDAPGQEGAAGICSTHHPFTAPKDGQDLAKLYSDPLTIVGDHYDLVINGTEIGGGSRRIHVPELQESIFRDVLKMHTGRIDDFRHLLDALAAGCPPHAGFAFGFDRLMTLLLDKDSVRDVIAFPKHGDGEDKFVGAPTALTKNQLQTYHLQLSDVDSGQPPARISLRA